MTQQQTKEQLFDQTLVELFRPTIDEAFVKHGDVLRSVVVIFDYYGPLNHTKGLNKGIWLGPSGPVTAPDAIVGSLENTVEVLSVILERTTQLIAHLSQQLGQLLTNTKEN